MRIKPLESTIQDLVYQVDVGFGRKLLQRSLFIFFALGVMAVYTMTRFHGLTDARAMEYAQLGYNLAEKGTFTTQCVRPFAVWYLANKAPNRPPRVGVAPDQLRAYNERLFSNHPDLLHPPAYPVVLASIFNLIDLDALRTKIGVATIVYPADYIPVAVNHVFTLLTGLLVLLLGWRMFDYRVGILAASAYFLSSAVWDQSIAGAEFSQAVFFSTLATYLALRVNMAQPNLIGRIPTWRWMFPCVLCAIALALAILTRYACIAMLPTLFVFIGISGKRRAWLRALLLMALALVIISPWFIRNYLLSGNPFGFSLYTIYENTFFAPDDAWMRAIPPVTQRIELGTLLQAIQAKFTGNFRDLLQNGLGLWKFGILTAIFIGMYFHRFARKFSRQLRWCLLPALLLIWALAALFGENTIQMMCLFWPFIAIYSWAFFMVLLDRLQFDIRFFPIAVISVLIALSALPLLLNVLPPRAPMPYPPYYHRNIAYLSAFTEKPELLTTDMPWATAWYGDRTSLLLPRNVEGFYEVNIFYKKINAAYFSPLIYGKPWASGLKDRTASEFSWYPILSGNLPSDFPLTYPTASSDQLFLADRRRW